MKNTTFTALVLAGAFMIAAPAAYAATADDISSDNAAISKDNTALKKDHKVTQQNRAAKAADKANDDYGKQAVDSVKLGANHATRDEKTTEKSVDKSIKQNDTTP
jgi:hypothetical protein